jgi:hypothetical protein
MTTFPWEYKRRSSGGRCTPLFQGTLCAGSRAQCRSPNPFHHGPKAFTHGPCFAGLAPLEHKDGHPRDPCGRGRRTTC